MTREGPEHDGLCLRATYLCVPDHVAHEAVNTSQYPKPFLEGSSLRRSYFSACSNVEVG